MTAPSKVSGSPQATVRAHDVLRARRARTRKFAISDGAPVEVLESGPSVAARLANLTSRLTIRPILTVGSHVPNLPWPWGLIDLTARVLIPASATVRETVKLPHASAQLVRAPGVLPADGSRRVVVYLHGGAFLTCGANSHGRLVEALSKFADAPILVVNYRLLPKNSVGMAIEDCHDAYRWLRLRGYQADQIVLAGDSAGGYLALTLAQRLQDEGEEPAALVAISPLLQLAKGPKQAHPNIDTDAMFSAGAFDALARAGCRRGRKEQGRRQSRGDLRAAGPHQAGPAAHADSRLGLRGVAARRAVGGEPAGRRRHPGRSAGVARPDPRLPAGRADGPGGRALAAPDRRLHPRGHRVARRPKPPETM